MRGKFSIILEHGSAMYKRARSTSESGIATVCTKERTACSLLNILRLVVLVFRVFWPSAGWGLQQWVQLLLPRAENNSSGGTCFYISVLMAKSVNSRVLDCLH